MYRPFLIATVVSLLLTAKTFGQSPVQLYAEAPELEIRTKDEWINSKPLKLADLRGQVVVLHFWTYGCINCVHNQPHYKSWHEKFSEKGVTIIGVHTPETNHERNLDLVRKSVEEKGLKYPIMVDQDSKTWNSWDNRWWPCTYLIDKKGIVRYRWDGELNWKQTKGEVIMRKKIAQLLAEPGPKRAKSMDSKTSMARDTKANESKQVVDSKTLTETAKDKEFVNPSTRRSQTVINK